MFLTPISSGSTILSNNYEIGKIKNTSYNNFTHTVIAEYFTTTECPYCITASNQIYSIYNSGELDFYFVSLVGDEGNLNIYERFKDLEVTSVPNVFFDGGYKHLTGAQSSEQKYKTAINQSGIREVPNIDISVVVNWLGGGKLKIEVTVINNEAEKYNGLLRTYIVEKESRWNDKGGNPYHYAALDIPIDRTLSLTKTQPKTISETYTFTKNWYGSLHGFGDIIKDNIMVIASVFDLSTGYAVQTSAGEPIVTNNYKPLKAMIFERLLDNFPILNKIINF
jgi:glutaredoxin